jgi:three-Cys-motif partner protein
MYYYDCFAGRGIYQTGELGSPIRIMIHMQKHSHRSIIFHCTAIEKNTNNYNNLVEIHHSLKSTYPSVQFEHHKKSFEEFIETNSETLSSQNNFPMFFFVDPFGFKVTFKNISELCHYGHSEVLVTFMSQNLARFLTSNRHSNAIEETIGSKLDDSIFALGLEDRQMAIVNIYKTNLGKVAKYVMSYRLKESIRDKTIYHLIHGSNHFEAFKLMKDILFMQGSEGTFTFYGPKENLLGKNQTRLSTPFEEDTFKDWLSLRFSGHELNFFELMKQSYQETKFIEKHYRSAVKKLLKSGSVSLKNAGPKGGINDTTIVTFKDVIRN